MVTLNLTDELSGYLSVITHKKKDDCNCYNAQRLLCPSSAYSLWIHMIHASFESDRISPLCLGIQRPKKEKKKEKDMTKSLVYACACLQNSILSIYQFYNSNFIS
jgi:hypothetical protein